MVMIRPDLNAACNLACADLPMAGYSKFHIERGIALLGLFPPNGTRMDFDVAATTMAEQMLKAIAVAKASNIGSE
jgi:hypothetical protein